ncbi:hypothetical protein BaRGS_00022408, partial [Batillaria attramentaria]
MLNGLWPGKERADHDRVMGNVVTKHIVIGYIVVKDVNETVHRTPNTLCSKRNLTNFMKVFLDSSSVQFRTM